ncbi:hypothetical protein [Streptomyces longwoodensis]|uniref:hypothetical protein n=1 Tax=Streptomyces longwoodensis TaxID=68231 RepID=UPI00225981FC|nr:hypothetical protein [Streptomyces longwoodensis]MCX4994684.1 hypothetical protein [Streptomyces longwoodensis]
MRFEDEVGRALRLTAGAYSTEQRLLAERALARGRRRVARRRIAVAGGSAMAAALVAVAGVQVGGSGDGGGRGNPAATSGSDHDYRRFSVTREEIQNILSNGMGRAGVATAHPEVTAAGSSGPDRPATASFDFGDGWGRARVTLSVRRVDPAQPGLKKLITCPPRAGSPYEECTTQSDNRAVKGYTEAGKAGGIKKWAVTMLSPHGYVIDVATYNLPSPSLSPSPSSATAHPGVRVTPGATARSHEPAPPLSRNPRMNPGKLRYLAMFVDASFTGAGKPNSFGTVTPGSRPEPGDILPVLKSLLPKRLHIYSEGGTGADGHVVVVDPKKGYTTYIQAERSAGDTEFWSQTLSDGTKVGTRRTAGEQPGVIELRADALRVNGLWMSLTAYNAPSPTSKKRGAEPAVTLDELKAMAVSRTWLLAR